jgi:hypothetical protein
MLETLTKQSRFVTIVYRDGYIVEANCWLKNQPTYTVNIRGKGATIEEAARECSNKLAKLIHGV